MKKTYFISLFFILFIGMSVHAQVLATSGNYKYTQADFTKAINFTEFLCNTKLSPVELESLKQLELKEFKETPAEALQNLENIDAQMQQIYALTDVSQIGMSRSMLIANLYSSIAEMPNDNAFKNIFNVHNIVLAIDPYNGISLTQQDVDSYFDYLSFYASLMGQEYIYDKQTRQAYTQNVIDLFLYGDNQTKAMLAIMTTYYNYLQASYNQLTPQQKQEYALSMTTNYTDYEQNYDYSNTNKSNNEIDFSKNDHATNQMYFNIMNDMNTQSHVTMMNSIEDFGNTGNYWEVVNY